MKQGRFYFISDEFYFKYDKEEKLMKNKETSDGKLHNRPCFFAFKDEYQSGIYWLVPISSRVEKYEKIYAHKIERQKEKGVLSPVCNTIIFGNILGHDAVFLVQNMFPITDKYIKSPYIDKTTNHEVAVSSRLEKEIISNAKTVLRLTKRGIKILFSDVMALYNALVLEETIKHNNQPSGLTILRELGGTFSVTYGERQGWYSMSSKSETVAALMEDWKITEEKAISIFSKAENQSATENISKARSSPAPAADKPKKPLIW